MINIIVARNDNNAIGKDNQLLYHISEDLKHFKILYLNIILMKHLLFKELAHMTIKHFKTKE